MKTLRELVPSTHARVSARSALVLAALLALLLGLGVTPALAVHNDGVFEIDGDVLDNPGAGTGDDWRTLFTCTASGCVSSSVGGALARNWAQDPAPASIFTGGGSKDQIDISQWLWKNGSVPDKDDLTSGFAARYTDRLYFGADRLANNGDAQIGTWFFQSSVFLCGGTGPNAVPAGTGGCTSGTFVDSTGAPAHQQQGNILVLSNFTNGGTTANIAAFVVTSVVPNGTVTLQLIAGSPNVAGNLACDTTPTPDTLCAATNDNPTTALGAYYVPKSGTGGIYPGESFFEGGLNLAAHNLQFECFGSFLHETRSSQSITAVLKDFVLATLQKCQSGIETHVIADIGGMDLTGNPAVAANTLLHDEAFVTGTPGVPTPTGTVDFEFFDNLECTSTPTAVETGKVLSEVTPFTATTAGVARAVSSSRTPLPGPHSYHAKYNGDGRYPPTNFSACEPFTVAHVASSVDTQILLVVSGSPTGEVTNQALDTTPPGNSVVDKATVTCSGFTPTGTVTFTFFASADCTGTSATQDVNLSSGVAFSSVQPITNGVFSFNAVYNGDNNCSPSSASTCEPVCGLPFKH